MASPDNSKNFLYVSDSTLDSQLSPSRSQNSYFPEHLDKNSIHYRVSSSPSYWSSSKSIRRNMTKFDNQFDWTNSTSKGSTSKLLRDHDRKITNIINDCALIQDELVGAWKSASSDVRKHKRHLKFIKSRVFSTKFNSFLHNDIFNREKKKFQENDINLTRKHEKVKSLLSSPKRSESPTRLPSPEGLRQQKSEQLFVTTQDIRDFETAQLVALNKRVFGETFVTEIKETPQDRRAKHRSMINPNEICPEQTILSDIKQILHQKRRPKHKKIEKPVESELRARWETQKLLEKVHLMSPVNQYIFSELDRIIPRTTEHIKRKSNPEKKSKKEEKSKTNKKEPENLSVIKHTVQKRISQMNYSKKKDLTKEALDLIKEIRIEAKDVKLKRRVQRLVTQRQHQVYINKELSPS